MGFIRRGNIRVPHKQSAHIVLHRFDGTPVRVKLAMLQCWEEYQPLGRAKVVMVYWNIGSATAVIETFEEIDLFVNGKAVAS